MWLAQVDFSLVAFGDLSFFKSSFIHEKFFTIAKQLQNITQRDLGGDDAINCFWPKLVHKSGFKALTPDRANCGYGWVAHWVHVLISEMLAKFRKVTKKRCGWCDVGGCGHCRGLWLSVVPVQEDGKRRRGRRRLRLNCPPPHLPFCLCPPSTS